MTEQEVKELYEQVKSLYGLMYKTTEDVYEEYTEEAYDHLGIMETHGRRCVGTKEVTRNIQHYNVMDAMYQISNGTAHLICESK